MTTRMGSDGLGERHGDREDYSEFLQDKPTNPAMAKLRERIDEYDKVCQFLEKYEELVERGKKRKKQLEEEEITQILEVDCGQSMCQFADGVKVEVKTDYYANIPSQTHIEKLKDADEAARLQARLDEALAWLDDNHPDVVKRKFEIMFGREDQKLADKFERDLAQRKRPLPVIRGRTVHPQTLNALVRNLIEQNFQVPRDLLGVHEKKVAKITRPR